MVSSTEQGQALPGISPSVPVHLPRHVAIIMDGNGRWAKRQGKSRIAGHRAGIKAVHRAIRFAIDQGLMALTLYAFSRENWQRPDQEVTALLALFFQVLESQLVYLNRYNVRLQIIGDTQAFSPSLQAQIKRAEAATADKQGLRLTVAANYSGRWDIVQAVNRVAQRVQQGVCSLEQIDEPLVASHLCLSDLPAVDLVIRTSGEYRLSNFLLWQMAYAELYFTDQLWPDFDGQTFQLALEAFMQRERRFGTVGANDLCPMEH
ncbi:polyprenyl diphosphate synthase [unidentified bacterial endosymbiont]|uniref:polyprenyl diphosphate synthase n=1 Tax=unidentified bacterial endosymbiont TaxID=2355 RepID=UPI0020A20A79|nr:polyprenyl diphosphate synthase [unidentified bacterial endosymbiont]